MPAGKPMPNTVPEKPWQHIHYGGLYNQVTVLQGHNFYMVDVTVTITRIM